MLFQSKDPIKFFRLQHLVIVVLVLVCIHLGGVFLYSEYSSELALETTRDNLIEQMVHLMHLAGKDRKNLDEQSLREVGLPYLTLTITQKPTYEIHVGRYEYWNLNEILNAKPLEVSYEVSENHWVNIHGTLITHANLWQMTLLAIELIVAIVLLYALWFMRRVASTIMMVNEGVEKLGVDPRPLTVPETGPMLIKTAVVSFNKMQQRIVDLLRERSKMLAAISHDALGPVTRLRFRAENMPDGPDKTANLNNLDDIEKMLKQLSQYAKQDYQVENVTRVDLHSLLQTICDDYDESQQLTFDPCHGRIVATVRVNLFKRVMHNLIGNALEYGEKAVVKTERQEGEIHIIVEDDGPGIDHEHIHKATEPFFRINIAGSVDKGHMGLGLSITQEIIKLHNGQLRLENKAPTGLRVTVILSEA